MVKRTYPGESPGDSGPGSLIQYLNGIQVDRLIEAFEMWHEAAPSEYTRRVRGRYLLAFLFLRYTGARIGEILRIDDSSDIDFLNGEVRLATGVVGESRHILRMVPIPSDIVGRVVAYVRTFPQMRGKVFALDQGNFRREFYRRANEADLPRQLAHPHILRHTRAIEMLRAGVPLTTVQDILGHMLSSTTTIYLQRSEVEIRVILSEKGLL